MSLHELLVTLLFGLVEGITEWLPISSTGHMILVEKFITLSSNDAFMEMFRVVIQLGAIMAVVVLYWNKIFPFKKKAKGIELDMGIMNLWFRILVASVPAAIIGLLFDDWIDAHFYNFQTVSMTLIIYGVLFIVIEMWNKGRSPRVSSLKDITYNTALIIGVFQVLALIPGTSRSGATIVGALLIGVSRTVAAEFTFYLAIPVMFGASFLKLLRFGLNFTAGEACILAVGMISAFLVSVFAIKFLMGYIKKHDFKVFGYYRIVLGFILIAYMFAH
ncbi:MAG: undecaprenyl-diphosphate phosphatase [bacterium]|nr:undecaprenyl-diphosphate phosphatase [bacterium]